MAEAAADRSLYGYFGQAIYSDDAKRWHFERALGFDHAIFPLGEPKELIPPAAQRGTVDARIDGKAGQSRRIEKQSKALLRSYPELQPACDLMPDLARVSEAVEDASARYDPMKGDLLAFGSIPDLVAGLPTEVIALPSGLNGCDLRVVQIQKQRCGWDDSLEGLDVPIPSGHEATWTGPGATIQAITFAQSIDSDSAFLAIRLLTMILTFRPIIGRTRHGSSKLYLNIVHLLSIDEAGGVPHAHLAFNPWNTRQFAVIDQAGSWTLRELGGDKLGTAEETQRGSLMDGLNHPRRAPVDDGWGKVAWVADSTTLAICNRRKLILYDLRDSGAQVVPTVSTALNDGSDWNLDMSIFTSGVSHVAVVTPVHVLVYQLSRDHSGALNYKRILRLKHFRNPGDISLRMHTFRDDQDVLMFLKSDISPIIILYRFHFSATGHVTVSDPSEFAMHTISKGAASPTRVSCLHVRSLPTNIEDDLHVDQSLMADAASRSFRFFSIMSLREDLSLTHGLYFSSPRAHSEHVVTPSWKINENGRVLKSAQLPKDLSNVYEGIEAINVADPPQEPVSAFVQQRKHQVSKRRSEDWTMSYELALEQINKPENAQRKDVNEIIDEAREKLQNVNVNDGVYIRTLRELAHGELTTPDLHSVIASLDDLHHDQTATATIRKPSHGSEPDNTLERLVLQRIEWPIQKAYRFNGMDHLFSLHQSVVDQWVTSLSGRISKVIRSTKEQLAIRIATELALASLVIRPEEAQEEEPQQSQDASQNLVLPVRPFAKPRSRSVTPSLYFDASSQPSSPATPSKLTSSNLPFTGLASEISRLSRYTTFAKPPSTLLPRSLNKVLSHWQPGADPASYDWQATSHRFAWNEEGEGEELTEKQRDRLQRRAERYVRRQRREAEESQRLQVLSSQAPELVTESQPQQNTSASGFNIEESSQLPLSQILSGRHGGRKPPRKKRKSGF